MEAVASEHVGIGVYNSRGEVLLLRKPERPRDVYRDGYGEARACGAADV